MPTKKLLAIAAWLIFFINWFSFNSCRDDNLFDLTKKDDTSSNVSCDTAFTISYKYDIAPIIVNNCKLCHTAAYYTFDGGDIRLDAWEFLKLKADDGKLLCAINQTEENGCQPMPRKSTSSTDKGDKLDVCYIDRITAWVRQGAQNN